ncbi:MAG: PAS domain-containing protein [Candidatus Eisenbacteria bacterium]|nr:PAS domain-containing protein [Candidatus Eisenbacteria bacterium]
MSVLDSLDQAVLLLDANLGVLLANRAATRMLGILAQAGSAPRADELLSPELVECAREVLRTGRARLGVAGHARGDASQPNPVRAGISPLEPGEGGARGIVVRLAVAASLDHQERRRRMQERLEALGELTAGVAHVVRNPLTGISSGVEFLGRQMARDPVQQENVAAILREVRRLDGLLEDLLRITHPAALELRPKGVEDLLREAARDLSARVPGARVRLACEARVGRPRLDAEQVRRAVVELAVNAAQASPEGAEVTLAAALASADATLVELGDPLLRIDVSDRGPGLPSAVRRAPFEPFRSTRSGARGLGLYTAHEIAARHGGELRLADEEGGGTRAILFLPWEIRDDD